MTAPAQHADLHAEIADHRAHATELVAAYRDAHARLGDPVAAFACTVGSAYTVLCHRRTAQVLAAAVQVIVEMQDAAGEKPACGEPLPETSITCTYPAGHLPIPAVVRRVGTRHMQHGNEEHAVWWNGNTATVMGDALEELPADEEQAVRAGVDRHWGPLAATGGEL